MNRTVLFDVDKTVQNVSLDTIFSIKTTIPPYDRPLPSFVEDFECLTPSLPRPNKKRARVEAAGKWDKVDMALYKAEIARAFGNCQRIESYNVDRVMDHPQLEMLPREGLQDEYPPCLPAIQYPNQGISMPYGLQVLVNVKKGDALGEYIGEFKTNPRGDYTLDVVKDNDEFKPPVYLDAEHRGNLMRFANHSCSPCAEIRSGLFSGYCYRNILTATRDIQAGEFITFKYGRVNFACRCGSTNCRDA
jgi:hypothetical protein